MSGHFDLGAAHDALAIDYSVYPLEERKQKLLEHLEQCIDEPPTPVQPSRVPVALYLLVSSWLIFGSVVRLALSLSHHVPLDALPFLSLVIGNGALIAYFRHTPRPRKERS